MNKYEAVMALHDLGFERVEGKGFGVNERRITDCNGEVVRVLALVSSNDVTFRVYRQRQAPYKFNFPDNYDRAIRYIQTYLPMLQEGTL